MTDRVVVLVDMDCFYCQVETKLNPLLSGKPVAVVQYNAWKGGGIIAVNYEARDKGVTRGMRGDDAKKHCPDIQLVSVPTHRDKADLTKYRDASREVIAVLCTFSECVERASIDEAYLDLTESIKQKEPFKQIQPFQISNTFVVGYSKEKCNDEAERNSGTSEWLSDVYSNGLNDESSINLAVAASIVEDIRSEVFKKTGFRCSAGIAHNKILSKLACGLHKPNRQTVLPHSSVMHLYKTLSVKKVRHLGGKLGDIVMEKLNCKVMADLFNYSEKDLKMKFDEKTGAWLYNIARGIDYEQVKARLVPKSIGCCKRFPGKTSLKSKDDVTYWLMQLTEELCERVLEDQSMNKRKANLLTVSMTLTHHQATSKSLPLTTYDRDKIYNSAYLAVRKICSDSKEENWSPIFCLGLSASKFLDLPTSGGINSFFQSYSNTVKNNSYEFLRNKDITSENVIEEEKPKNNSFFSKFIKKADEVSTSDCSEDNLITNNVKNLTAFVSPGPVETSNSALEVFDSLVTDFKDQNVKSASTISGHERNSNSLEKPVKQTLSFKGFFDKQKVVSGDNGDEKEGVSCTAIKKSNSIEGYFKNNNGCEVVNPLDVFPDLTLVDDEMLQYFPISFRRKVIELKKKISEGSKNLTDTDRNSFKNDSISISVETNNKNISRERFHEGNARSETDNAVSYSENTEEEKLSEIYEDKDIFEDSCDENTSNEPTGIYSKYFSSNLETCPECGESFEKSYFSEHQDFHFAQRINLEINSVSTPSTSSAGNQLKPNNSVVSSKRKQCGRGKKINESKKFKTLKTFFVVD